MNPSRVALPLLLGSLSGLAPSMAAADEPEPEVSTAPAETPEDVWARLLAVEIIGGVDTPYGLVGGAMVVSPMRNLAFDLGGGYSRDGGRLAGGARLVLPHASGALGFRVGLAGGPLSWDTDAATLGNGHFSGDIPASAHERRTWDFTAFLDTSVSLEMRLDSGVYLRFMFGAEHALSAPGACTVAGGSCAAGSDAPTRAYVGLAAGYALDL